MCCIMGSREDWGRELGSDNGCPHGVVCVGWWVSVSVRREGEGMHAAAEVSGQCQDILIRELAVLHVRSSSWVGVPTNVRASRGECGSLARGP